MSAMLWEAWGTQGRFSSRGKVRSYEDDDDDGGFNDCIHSAIRTQTRKVELDMTFASLVLMSIPSDI